MQYRGLTKIAQGLVGRSLFEVVAAENFRPKELGCVASAVGWAVGSGLIA